MKQSTVFSALVLGLLTLSVAEGGWWRGNTHTHSNLSDGNSSPAAVAAQYLSLGYDFLVLTDHNKLSDFAQYSSPGFLCINGEEITSTSSMHVNGLGVTSLVPTGTYQAMVDGVNAQGVPATFNHPTWSSKGANDIYPVAGLKFMEIYNGLVDDQDEPIWDTVLSMGKQIYGVCSDDCHTLASQSGKAWIVVRAPSLTQSDIFGAMNAGDFYASTGVVLNDYVAAADHITVDSQDGNLIEFVGFQGAVLASVAGPYAEYQFTDSDPFVRARITNAAGKHAWTQPVFRFPPPPLPPPPTIHGVTAAAIDVPAGSTTDAASIWSIVGSGPKAVVRISRDNKADFTLSIDGFSTNIWRGVMMATPRQNLRDGQYYSTVEVSHVNYFGDGIASDVLQVATSRAYSGGEYNSNVAVGFFPFGDGWIGSHVLGTGALLDHYGVAAGNVTRTAAGRYTVTVDGINSQTDGILLAVSAENGYNFVSTAPSANGSGWEIAERDTTATTFAATEDARWSFVYVDYDAPGLTGGRIAADGSVVSGKGSFSVTHTEGAGVYRITVPGYTPGEGVLMLTVSGYETEGSTTSVADNIILYEASGNTFLVNVRDRNVGASDLADCGFVFAFLPYNGNLMPAVPGDANYDGQVDADDAAILADHWGDSGATWAMGDFNLDGVIGAADASILAANWGHGTSEAGAVPEPSSLGLVLGVAVTSLLYRRRRKG
jgi:hypothetical protein